MTNEKIRLTECTHCGSTDIEEVGWDIFVTDDDDDLISELQYRCHDCNKLCFAWNSFKKGEFDFILPIPDVPEGEEKKQ